MNVSAIALCRLVLLSIVLGAMPSAHAAHAAEPATLVNLINAYRAAPGQCEGKQAEATNALTPNSVLSDVRVGTGEFLDLALERAGYQAAHADAIYMSGTLNAQAVMTAIRRKYCAALLSSQFLDIGARRSGDSWLIVLAQPAPPSRIALLTNWEDAGKSILEAVNAARSSAQICGERKYAPAPALTWNGALGVASLTHSQDMALQRYFNHVGKDGRISMDRAVHAGYKPRRIGENIAAGQETATEVVLEWLASPGHCANIMNPDFIEMGAAFAINTTRDTPRVYWTQVFGTQR